MALLAGKLNRRVTIQEPTWTRSGDYNEASDSWGTLATVWAAVEPLRGEEAILAQQTTGKRIIKWRIRYRDDVTIGMRLKEGTAYFDINAVVDPFDRHEELHLGCTEAV